MKRLAAFLAGVGLALPGPAWAYHMQMNYPLPATEGGGNGMYFTGSPRWKGYDCAICHVDGTGITRFTLSAEPPDLLQGGAYQPGATYQMRVVLTVQNPTVSTRNQNAFVLEILDDALTPQGSFTGESLQVPEGMHEPAMDGVIIGRSAGTWELWDFVWKAPEVGAGRLSLYLGGVDGDGGGAGNLEEPSVLTDPLGDDVFMLRTRFCQQGQDCSRSFDAPDLDKAFDSPASLACRGGTLNQTVIQLLLVAGWLFFWNRRRR